MSNEVSYWSRLWTTEAKDHVLVRTSQEGDHLEFHIFDMRTRTIDIIEDDSLYLQIVDEMLKAGVSIVDRIPSDPGSIETIIDEMFAAGRSIAEISQTRRVWFAARFNGKD